MPTLNVSILIFDDVEVLDFAGPFEVFSVTNELSDCTLLNVCTVAPRPGSVVARNGLTIIPHGTIADASRPDILIIPGGQGTRPLLNEPDVLNWIQKKAVSAKRVLSVCTGALLLGKVGLLDGLTATTHASAFDLLAEIAPGTRIDRQSRFVDNGAVVTSAGISAGIDMSLHVVEQLFGKGVADRTATYMEYRRP